MPYAHITLIVNPWSLGIVERCPYVDDILTFNGFAFGQFAGLRVYFRATIFALRRLFAKKYDVAIIPRFSYDETGATFISYFSGARFRIAYSERVLPIKQRVNRHYDVLLTHVLNDATVKHEVEKDLDVLRIIGGEIRKKDLELWPGEPEIEYAKSLFASHGISSSSPVVALGIGAGKQKNIWPLSKFIKVGEFLSKNYNAIIVLVGGKKEMDAAQLFQMDTNFKIINLTGTTNLAQTTAILSLCHLYVGNDSGTTHVASAVGIPVVMISSNPINGVRYASNSPERFGPWSERSLVVRPQYGNWTSSDDDDINGDSVGNVTLEQVIKAAQHLLNMTARNCQ
jgi:heptosyltransferase-2